MTSAQMKILVAFWSQVRQIESRIRENGHRHCPLDIDDRWNHEFEDAYEAIRPLLVCISNPRLFVGVSSLPHLRGPFEAKNAHQALLFQLNPEEAMYGNPALLEAKEFVTLRKLAEAESELLASMNEIPVAVPVLPKCGAAIWDEDYVRRWKIPEPSAIPSSAISQTTVPADPLDYTLSETRMKLVEATDNVPRSIKDLAKRADCDYQTAKGYLPKLKNMGLVRKVKQGYVRPR